MGCTSCVLMFESYLSDYNPIWMLSKISTSNPDQFKVLLFADKLGIKTREIREVLIRVQKEPVTNSTPWKDIVVLIVVWNHSYL